MALGQVAARTEGDMFQGMFFWHQAAALLAPELRVSRVVLEHDDAGAVDDIAVYYDSPGIDAGGYHCVADFFQIKYHVDQSDVYSSDNFCDPNFIGRKQSILKRFYDTHLHLRNIGRHRLNFISNWNWKSEDPLLPLLRESGGGSLPSEFFTAGPRSNIGKVREAWRDHLEASPEDFEGFARSLCLGINFMGRMQFKGWLNDRLRSCGLVSMDVAKAANTYDSLTQQFITNQTNDFDKTKFLDMCHRENLLAERAQTGRQQRIAVRSFIRFAEQIEEECDKYVCVSRHFDGRHIIDNSSWNKEIIQEIGTFLQDRTFRSNEWHILLECHSSIAFFSGYQLERKSGAQVFPIQKGPITAVWKPSGNETESTTEWLSETEQIEGTGTAVAFAVSVTRDVSADVQSYVATLPNTFKEIVYLKPTLGVGAGSVKGPDHAVALSDRLADQIRKAAKGSAGGAHLFPSMPNALMYFLGQHGAALGTVQLYEFDFEGRRGGSYTPSIKLTI